jgi:hypothetical protein
MGISKNQFCNNVVWNCGLRSKCNYQISFFFFVSFISYRVNFFISYNELKSEFIRKEKNGIYWYYLTKT